MPIPDELGELFPNLLGDFDHKYVHLKFETARWKITTF